MYTFYQYPKCTTCRKAKAELDSLGLSAEVIDVKENPPSAETIKSWVQNSGLALKSYFNTSGNSYRHFGLKDRVDSLSLDEAAELLSNDGMLIKRPILIKNDKVLQIGYRTSYEDLNLG